MAARPLSGPGREDVVQAALAVIDVEGPQGLTVRRVAEALGTSTQIVYSRFGGMEGLLAAAGLAVFRHLTLLGTTTPADPDPLHEVTALALTFRDYSLANPHRMALMTAPLTDVHAHAQAKVEAGLSMDRLTHPIARAVTGAPAGAPASTDPAHVQRLGEVLWAALNGLVEMERSGHLDPDHAEGRIRLLVTRLLARP